MNKVMLIGRIANDLELRTTPSGSSVCEFRLATNRPVNKDGERIADFITCMVWNKQAENLTKYQSKGSLIAVVGAMRVDSYDGNDGKKKYKSYVFVNEIEYLESKKAEETQEEKTETNPYEEFGNSIETESEFGEQMEITDEDLPF